MTTGISRWNFAPGIELGLCALLAFVLLGVGPAKAISYFNGPDGWGFDNSGLGLEAGYEIALDATFPTIAGPGSGATLILEIAEEINDPQGGIQREIEWTITALEAPADVLVFFSALAADPSGYEDALIDIEPLSPDLFAIADFGPYIFAGFVIPAEELGGDGAVRSFRYTVNLPQGWDGPPGLGVAATADFTIVPEPGVGLMVGFGLLALSARRREHRCR